MWLRPRLRLRLNFLMKDSQDIAIVTGASGAIGSAVCKRLVDSGYVVKGFDICPVDDCWDDVLCDLSDVEAIQHAFASSFSSLVAPSVFVHCAGIYEPKSWDLVSVDDFRRTMDINFSSAFYLSQLWAQRLIEAQKAGSAVFLSSVSVRSGSLNPVYAASKSALEGFSRSLAKSLAPHDIRVNAIAPGPVESAMMQSIPEARVQSYLNAIPMGRFGVPSEIADLVMFLVGNQSRYMTGSVIPVDGGM